MHAFIDEIGKKVITPREIDDITKLFELSENRFAYVNPIVYLEFRKRPELLQYIDGLFMDGMLLSFLYGIIGYKSKRCSPDMVGYFGKLFQYAVEHKKRIFFLGSNETNLRSFIKTIKSRFPEMEIVGFRNGYFNNDDEKLELCLNLVKDQVEILIVGMGSPHQETMLMHLNKSNFKGQTFTCGGFIHQTTKKIDYYPKWINKYDLRWLYRFFDERRVFYRTIKIYPVFVVIFLYDFLRFKLISRKSSMIW